MKIHLLMPLLVSILISLDFVLQECESTPYSYEQKNKTFYKVVNDPKQVKPDYPTRSNLFGWINPKALVKFRLWTRQNPQLAQEIKYNDNESLQTSNFDLRKLTKVIIHGFADGASEANIGDWMIFMRNAYIKLADLNVIVVDYSIHALFTRYLTGRPEIVADRVAEMLSFLESRGANLSSFHLIGWSWGAQISGLAGHQLKGVLGRITGIDPAGPTFKFVENEFRLDKTDAKFVDILHVNGGTRLFWGAHFGLKDPLGHVDVYANGGEKQIGCPRERPYIFETLWCSHGRGPKYWTESITSPMAFPSCPCEDFDNYIHGECNCTSQTHVFWGEHIPHKTRGTFQLITRSHPPYGHGPQMEISISSLQLDLGKNRTENSSNIAILYEQNMHNFSIPNTFTTKYYPNTDILDMSVHFIRNISLNQL